MMRLYLGRTLGLPSPKRREYISPLGVFRGLIDEASIWLPSHFIVHLLSLTFFTRSLASRFNVMSSINVRMIALVAQYNYELNRIEGCPTQALAHEAFACTNDNSYIQYEQQLQTSLISFPFLFQMA